MQSLEDTRMVSSAFCCRKSEGQEPGLATCPRDDLRANEVSTGPRSELTRRRSWLVTGRSDAGWVIRLGRMVEVEDEAWVEEDMAISVG